MNFRSALIVNQMRDNEKRDGIGAHLSRPNSAPAACDEDDFAHGASCEAIYSLTITLTLTANSSELSVSSCDGYSTLNIELLQQTDLGQ